jgi:hypothetical protein
MKSLLWILLLLVTSLIPLSAHARESEILQSPQHADFMVSGRQAPGMDKIRASIVQAGSARGWQVTAEQPGQLTLHNMIRHKHEVVVTVSYDTKGVSVAYVSSSDLDYAMRGGTAYIHPKYNEWVKLLLKDIVAKASA